MGRSTQDALSRCWCCGMLCKGTSQQELDPRATEIRVQLCPSARERSSSMFMALASWCSGPVSLLDGHSTLQYDTALKELVEQTVRGSSLQLAAGPRPSSQLLAWGCYSDPSQRCRHSQSARIHVAETLGWSQRCHNGCNQSKQSHLPATTARHRQCSEVTGLFHGVARMLETVCHCVLPSDFPQQGKDGIDDGGLSR